MIYSLSLEGNAKIFPPSASVPNPALGVPRLFQIQASFKAHFPHLQGFPFFRLLSQEPNDRVKTGYLLFISVLMSKQVMLSTKEYAVWGQRRRVLCFSVTKINQDTLNPPLDKTSVSAYKDLNKHPYSFSELKATT